MFFSFLASFYPFSNELLNLIFYCLQQFGMALGLGAETVLLIAYLVAVRDGLVDEQETRFLKAARFVAGLGVFCIIASGAGITLMHYLHGEAAVVLAPAFLFKWSLVGIVFLLRIFDRGNSLSSGLFEGFSGATWYALFLVHILAPETGWSILGVIYGAWVLGFVLLWSALVLVLRGNPELGEARLAHARRKNYSETPGQTPYTPYQPMYASAPAAANKPSIFPPQPTVARAFSSAPPVTPTPAFTPPSPAPTPAPAAPTTSVAMPPAPPPPPVPPAPPTISPVSETPKTGLSHIQVMPRSPSEIPKAA